MFPHLTVFENIAFGLRMQKRPNDEIKRRAGNAAELMQIDALLERYPAQLSGGQRQRVAVARGLVMEPEVLLLDEPLSNLDALLRLQSRAELKRLLQEVKTTTVYVTHDQIEALSMGDRSAVMQSGQIIQSDIPAQVYNFPGNRFVGSFIGTPPMNFLLARFQHANGSAAVMLGDQLLHSTVPPNSAGRDVVLGIRAENIEAVLQPAPDAVAARVLVIEPLGSHLLLTAQIGTESLKVVTRVDFPVALNQTIYLRIEPGMIRWFDPTSGMPVKAAA